MAVRHQTISQVSLVSISLGWLTHNCHKLFSHPCKKTSQKECFILWNTHLKKKRISNHFSSSSSSHYQRDDSRFPPMSSTETVSHTQAPVVSNTSLEISNQHSLPVIITLVLLSFFFFGFFSIYFVRCIFTFFIRRSNTTNTPPQPPSKAQGLDPSILETFPTFVYSSVKDLREDKSVLECAVCLSEFQDSDMLRLLTICNHAFHPECVDLWLGSHTTCPVCRRNLDPNDEKAQEINITIDEEDGTTAAANEGEETGTNHSVGEGSHRMVSVHENAEEEEQGRRVVDNGDDDDDDHNHGEDEDHVDGDLERGNNNREHAAAEDNKMLRSHSTGHSIIRKDVDRYTLRLPENVKESITRGHHHNWTASCITFGEFTGDVTAGKSGLGEVSGVSNGDIIRV